MDLDTKGGSISVGNLSGNVELDTGSENPNAKTWCGNTKVELSEGDALVVTSGGNIKVVQRGKIPEADISGDSITAELIKSNKNIDAHVDPHTSDGSITLSLPKTHSATVAAEIKISNNAWRDYSISS